MITILIRTSYRPKQFQRMVQSVYAQTYQEIRLIVGYDDERALTYIPEEVNKIKLTPDYSLPIYYDQYCNELKALVTEGWFFFLDDDDYIPDPMALEKIAKNLTIKNGLVCQFKRNGYLKPTSQRVRNKAIEWGKIGMPCIFLHHSHKDILHLDGSRIGADFYYIRGLADLIPLDFVPIVVVHSDQRSNGKMEMGSSIKLPAIASTPKVNLFISIYPESDLLRKEELMRCLQNNLANSAIDHVYALQEENGKYHPNSKLTVIPISHRPIFGDYFKVVNSVTSAGDTNIISNSDIYFEEKSIRLIKASLSANTCFALTRYDVAPDASIAFLNRRDSQDSWCFRGKIRYEKMVCDFLLGKPGCDNRIAHEIQKAHYQISNPSKAIKSYHLHNSQVKSYVRSKEHVVGPPYLRLEPKSL